MIISGASVVYRVHQPFNSAVMMWAKRKIVNDEELKIILNDSNFHIIDVDIQEYDKFFPRAKLKHSLMFVNRPYVEGVQSELCTLAVPNIFVEEKEPEVLSITVSDAEELYTMSNDLEEDIYYYTNTRRLPLGILTIEDNVYHSGNINLKIPRGYFENQLTYMRNFVKMPYFELKIERTKKDVLAIIPVEYTYAYNNAEVIAMEFGNPYDTLLY